MKHRDLKPGELRRLMRPIYRSAVRVTDAHGRLVAIVRTDPVTGRRTRQEARNA